MHFKEVLSQNIWPIIRFMLFCPKTPCFTVMQLFTNHRQRHNTALSYQVRALYFPPVDGQGGVLPHEAGDDVCPARDGSQEEVRLDVPVHVVVRVGLEGRTGGADGPEGRQPVGPEGPDSNQGLFSDTFFVVVFLWSLHIPGF